MLRRVRRDAGASVGLEIGLDGHVALTDRPAQGGDETRAIARMVVIGVGGAGKARDEVVVGK